MKRTALYTRAKNIILVGVILTAFLCSFFLLVSGVQKEKLAEKFADMQTRLELIAYQTEIAIERENNFEQYHIFYEDHLIYSIQFIDTLQATFAAVYNKHLENVSSRHPTYEGSPFDPLLYSEFIEAVNNNKYGILAVSWGDKDNNLPYRTINICYRWTFTEIDNPYLLVIGISKESLNSPSLNFILVIIYIVFLVAFFLLLGMVIYVVRDLYIRFRSVK